MADRPNGTPDRANWTKKLAIKNEENRGRTVSLPIARHADDAVGVGYQDGPVHVVAAPLEFCQQHGLAVRVELVAVRAGAWFDLGGHVSVGGRLHTGRARVNNPTRIQTERAAWVRRGGAGQTSIFSRSQ